jgi:WD40 repeat protein
MIRLWNVGTWDERLGFVAHPKLIHRIAFSPDGNTLASGSVDQTVKLWSCQDGSLVNTLRGHYERVTGLGYAPDGSLLASSSMDGAIKLWNGVQKPRPLAIKGHKAFWTVRVAYSADHLWLGLTTNILLTNPNGVSPVVNRTAIYHASSRRFVADVPGHPFVFAGDGRLATKTSDSAITLWSVSVAGVQEHAVLSAPAKLLLAPALASSTTFLASDSASNQLFLWDLKYPSKPRVIPRGSVRRHGDLQFSPDGRILFAADADKSTIEYWNTMTLEHDGSIPIGNSDYQAFALSPDGRTLAAMDSDHTLFLWDIRSRKKLRDLPGTKEWIVSLVFSPDGRTLVGGGIDGALKLYSLPCGSEVIALPAHKSICRSVSFSPDGSCIAAAGVDDLIKFWFAPTFPEIDAP